MMFAVPALLQAPPIMPIDFTALLGIFMGTSINLIPVLEITARFALKPTVEALSRFFDRKGDEEAISILERRMALMEQQTESIEGNVHRLVELNEFHYELKSPVKEQTRLPPVGEED